MKHYTPPPPDLVTEEEIVIELAGKVRRRGDHGRVAAELGISQPGLSNILTAGRGIGPRLAAALGYRKVTRFERIERPILANHGRSAERVS